MIFNFHIHLFTHTHATLPNASTNSQSHAPPGSHASTSSHTSSHWLRAWLSTDHSQQAVSSAPLGPCDPQTSSQAHHHHPPTTQRQPRARRQAWHMLGICMACSCLRICMACSGLLICMACSGLPVVQGDVSELQRPNPESRTRPPAITSLMGRWERTVLLPRMCGLFSRRL